MAVKSIERFGACMRAGILAVLAGGLAFPAVATAQAWENGRGHARSEMRSEDGGNWGGRSGGGGGGDNSGRRASQAPVPQSAPQAQPGRNWSGGGQGWRQRSDAGSAPAWSGSPANAPVVRSEAPPVQSPGGGWSGRRGGWSGQSPAPQATAPAGVPDAAANARTQGDNQGRRDWRGGRNWSGGASPTGQTWGSNGVRAPRPATTGEARRAPDGNGQWQSRNRDYAEANRNHGQSESWRGRDSRNGWRDGNRQGQDRWNSNGWRHDSPRGGYANSNQRWDRDWRRDNRYDWQGYRSKHRDRYRMGRYHAPYSGYYYTRPFIGFQLDTMFYSNRYWLDDPWEYRLPAAYGPYRWVRYYDDALMVDIYTGEVVDVIHDFFW